jgi:single-strand DNA-binding protein
MQKCYIFYERSKIGENMSASLNQITLIGRIGKKPEIMKMQNDDKKIAKFSLATSEYWKDKETNERKEKTEWHRVVVYSSKLAEIIENYVDEGSLVYLQGKIKYEKWTDAQGIERKLTTIVIDLNGQFRILERKKTAEASNEGKTNNHSFSVEEDDDIPF